MEIEKFNSCKSYSNNEQIFKAKWSNKKTLHKILVRPSAALQAHSIESISDIKPQVIGGTRCKGSIPLKNFWDFFDKKNKNIRYLGYSTNKDGYGDCFLKSNSSMPISTSFVHDCSVMYLYNEKTQTHALYHAVSDCSEDTLKFMLTALMPEGFTRGAIIPGDSVFFKAHSPNMHNMLKLMKQYCPNALVNVYHSTLKYPEIVGKAGKVYQIPNKKVQKQLESGVKYTTDFGQATFRIVDVEGYNTFDNILFYSDTETQLSVLKHSFMMEKYPKAVKEILFREIDKMKKFLENQSKSGSKYRALNNKLKNFSAGDDVCNRELYEKLDEFYKRVSAEFNKICEKLDFCQNKICKSKKNI